MDERNGIIESWEINASEWIKALQKQTIASRKITSPAIFNTIKKLNPAKVLDVGCGEGWLTYKLHQEGIEAVGIDGTPVLIKRAKTREGHYFVQTFEEIIEGAQIPEGPFELAVFNFCLYLNEGTGEILKAVGKFLDGRQQLVIQTLHPFTFIGADFKYQSQWLPDSWKGLSGSFSSPHKWYFRTLQDWVTLIRDSGYKIEGIDEPTAKDGKAPASIIFVLTINDKKQL